MTIYNFDKQNEIEEFWSPLICIWLQGLFNAKVEDVRAKHLEYDFVCDGKTFDLKADRIIGNSKNFFIETESIKGIKKGWFFNTETDWILYLDTQNMMLYMLPLRELQKHTDKLERWFTRDVHQDKNYITCGKAIPKSEIQKWLPTIRQIDLTVLKDYALKVGLIIDKWANNLEKRLKKRGQEIKRK